MKELISEYQHGRLALSIEVTNQVEDLLTLTRTNALKEAEEIVGYYREEIIEQEEKYIGLPSIQVFYDGAKFALSEAQSKIRNLIK